MASRDARGPTYAAVRGARRPLLAEGYLVASFDNGGRVGHTAECSHPSDLELDVALPPRRYDLVSQMLAEASCQSSPVWAIDSGWLSRESLARTKSPTAAALA